MNKIIEDETAEFDLSLLQAASRYELHSVENEVELVTVKKQPSKKFRLSMTSRPNEPRSSKTGRSKKLINSIAKPSNVRDCVLGRV